MSLGSTILKYRKTLGITQESLAQQLEVTNQAVSKWESDQCCPDVMLLPRLADIFGITIDELFGREPKEKPVQTVAGLPWPDDGNLRGVLFHGWELVGHGVGPKLKLFFNRNVDGDVCSDFSVVCGDVAGSIEAGGYVQCSGIGGYVEAGGSVECEGAVDGYVEAGGNVACGDVSSYVEAGGNIACGNVRGGYVEAGGDVACGDVVGGYVEAGGDVTCQNVTGHVDADGEVHINA